MEGVQTGQDRPLFALNDPVVLAVTSDGPVAAPVPGPPLSDIEALGDFVTAHAVASGVEAQGNKATARTSRSPPIAVGEAAELIPARGRPLGHVSTGGQVVFVYPGGWITIRRMIVERVLLPPPGAFIVRVGCSALRVVCSRILKSLLSDLMLVPLVTGDAATDRP
jgi:hypothetical protein